MWPGFRPDAGWCLSRIYSASRIYLSNINFSNTVNDRCVIIDSIDMSWQRYRNRTASGAVTAIPRQVLIGVRRASSFVVVVLLHQTAPAEINGSAPPITPPRESVSPSRLQVSVPRPPLHHETRPGILRLTALPASVRFETNFQRKQPQEQCQFVNFRPLQPSHSPRHLHQRRPAEGLTFKTGEEIAKRGTSKLAPP